MPDHSSTAAQTPLSVMEIPGDGLIDQAFRRHAAATPHATALLYEGERFTYADVEARSVRVARQLQAHGCGAGARVAILAERRPELIWTLLGVLRCGGVFILLDSAYPKARLASLLALARPTILLAPGSEMGAEAARALGAQAAVPLLAVQNPASAQALTSFAPAAPTAPAYMIFTSGSTGQPKGVACSHVPLRHFIAWHIRTFGFTASDRFSMLAGLSHDPLLRDIFTPLSIGATLVIPRQATITEPGGLRTWFARTGITVTHLTPAMGQLLMAGAPQAPSLPKLRHMFWGGDKLLPQLLDDVSRFAPAAQHTNFYGCSETPQAAAYYRYDGRPGWPTVPIGTGTDGFDLRVVDEAGQIVAPGETGEIVIRSRFLSLGYVQDGQILPTAEEDGLKTYATGDRGCYLQDGNVLFLGRADDQIKIRGFRVELAEVTSALLACPGVLSAQALKLPRDARPAIAAFIAVAPEHTGCRNAVRTRLAAQLPGYMLPEQIWVFERQLPLLPNGKVDRQALLAHAERDLAAAQRPDPATGTGRPLTTAEAALTERWNKILGGNGKVLIDQSFVSLGGDSLSYVAAYLAAEEIIGTVPPGWTDMSVATLATASRKKSRFFSTIDSFVLLRALSISLIVAYHFGLTKLGDGFTGALFMVSGFLFGGMQLRDVFNRGSASRILLSAKNILIPTLFFILLYATLDLARHRLPPLSELTLNSDLANFAWLQMHHMQPIRSEYIFWYIDSLLKILLIMFLLVRFMPAQYRRPIYRFRFCLLAFVVGCAVKFGVPFFTEPGFLHHGAPEMSQAQTSPIGNFATFMLGALLANLPRHGKFLWIVASLLFAALDGIFYGLMSGIAVAGATLMLTVLPRVTMPKFLATLVFMTSSASLYIYLTHLLWGEATRTLLGPHWPAVQMLLALAGGVAVQKFWDAGAQFLASGKAQHRWNQGTASGRAGRDHKPCRPAPDHLEDGKAAFGEQEDAKKPC
jgi:amino acid adenylation domain-containing protein